MVGFLVIIALVMGTISADEDIIRTRPRGGPVREKKNV